MDLDQLFGAFSEAPVKPAIGTGTAAGGAASKGVPAS